MPSAKMTTLTEAKTDRIVPAIRNLISMLLFCISACSMPTGSSQSPSYPAAGTPQPRYAGRSLQPAISPVQLSALPNTVGIEHSDRINRLGLLSSIYGVDPPRIDELQINPTPTVGIDYPVPVIRIVFLERVFFDFDRAELRPYANKVLDLIADNMRRDVPDAQVLLLGHTDAIGTDAYNIDLSRRRAVSVMEALIARGVRPSQLSTIAIGKRQPIAPNDTGDGRARNRRVEFVISTSQAANVELVRRRRTFEEYLKTTPTDVAVNIPREVQIEKPATVTANQPAPTANQPQMPGAFGGSTTPGKIEATPHEPERIEPKLPGSGSSIGTQSVGRIKLRTPEPKLLPHPNLPAEYESGYTERTRP